MIDVISELLRKFSTDNDYWVYISMGFASEVPKFHAVPCPVYHESEYPRIVSSRQVSRCPVSSRIASQGYCPQSISISRRVLGFVTGGWLGLNRRIVS